MTIATDLRQLRNCLGRWPTGVAVVTTRDAMGEPRGLTINSLSSVSLEPALVLWSLSQSAKSFAAFASANEFAVNVLAQHQAAVAMRFARSGGDKFEALDFDSTAMGTPVLRQTAAAMVCDLHALHNGGDHLIVVGRVKEFQCGAEASLLCSRGRFHVVGDRLEM